MKIKNYCSSLLLFIASFTSLQAGTIILDTIVSNGVEREFRIYLPSIYDGSTAVPLVFNLHGFSSNAIQQESYGDFRPIADTANFIIIHPLGLTVSALGTTGPGWTSSQPLDSNTDLIFLEELMDHIIAEYNINTNRVYSTGMSNGGFMSYDLACFLSDRIAAIASVTGTMNFVHHAACNPNKPMPIMQIHGTADAVVDFNGSAFNVSIDSLVNFFVAFNNCNPTPTFTPVPDIDLSDGCTAEHYVYSGGGSGSSVEFYKVIGGDHTWPGAPLNLSTTNMDFSASKEIWRFFSQFSFATGVDETATKAHHSIYPNPAKEEFTLVAKNYNNAILKVVNVLGKTVLEKAITKEKTTINCETLPAGIYFYQVRNTSDSIGSGKLILD